MTGSLYVVATPIGNLEDITLRALKVLKDVDAIICETPAVTKKLLAHFDIHKPLMTWRQRSHDAGVFVSELKGGKHLAYLSDAGTPLVADPGGTLVENVARAVPEAHIIPIPGPSAILAALSIAGFPADRFCFLGFPPSKKGRRAYFADIARKECTAVFFEGPHRIVRSLRELTQALTTETRSVVVCRELTKIYESIYRGNVAEVIERVTADPVKGEYTIVVAPSRVNQADKLASLTCLLA